MAKAKWIKSIGLSVAAILCAGVALGSAAIWLDWPAPVVSVVQPVRAQASAVVLSYVEVLSPTLFQTFKFNRIYERRAWGTGPDGVGTSGSGSTMEATEAYRDFIEALIRDKKITSVVDGGCGDWEFSRYIDWGDADYLGIDVSSETIERVSERYAGPKVRFEHGDITEPMPGADLLIVKDVLMHLPNSYIQDFIRNNLESGRYRIAVITNNRESEEENNKDIPVGDFRGLDLSREPFNVKGLEDAMIFESEQKIVQVLRFGDGKL